MPTIQYTAQLDFTDNGTFETGWRIKQGDFGDCEIVFRVVNNGVNMYDALVTPEIVFRRADGASVISNMTPNDGTYKYTFVGNELAVPGLTLVDVKYTDSEGRISTASCRFTVVEDTLGYDPTGAHTYDNPVSELVEQATAASEVAIDSSYKAEGFAVGEQGGVPVGPDSPYYHNNAKYYGQELAREIEVNKQNGYLQNKNLWHYSLTHNNSFQYAYAMPSDARTFTISIKKTLAKQINACAYDGEGTKIVADFKILGADETTGTYTLTVNTACFLNIYIVSSVAGDDSQVSEVQVEVGSTATAYMQYAPSNIELANSKADITSIGTDESGRTTASKAYAIGEHFYKDGKFCTAKTAIASGATFTLNTNYEEGDVATELRGTGNVGISTTGYTQTNYELVTNNLYMRNGRVVMYLFVKVLNPSVTVFIDIGVLPDSIDKPLTDILDTSMSFDGGYNGGIPFQYSINPTTGKVAVRGGVVGCRYPASITY